MAGFVRAGAGEGVGGLNSEQKVSVVVAASLLLRAVRKLRMLRGCRWRNLPAYSCVRVRTENTPPHMKMPALPCSKAASQGCRAPAGRCARWRRTGRPLGVRAGTLKSQSDIFNKWKMHCYDSGSLPK